MTSILAAAASGMQHNQTVLDVRGHNLANANSLGFQRFRVLAEGAPTAPGAPSRLGISETQIDLLVAPGELIPTGDPMHFALADDAFFQVRDFGGETVLTRVGALTFDATGQITTADGRLLDPPITMPAGSTSPTIDTDGLLTAINPEGELAAAGQLQLVRFGNSSGLEALGGGLYRETANSGTAIVGTAGEGPFAALVTRTLEGANVETALEVANIIVAQRAYQANARSFSIGDQMLEIATDLTA